ncbi:unnamed protein product [Callosobruchus maculatus]|uniref:Uncharacterized protein n=1 Tax=Callosobruchus maculatus TaxID=64391 RepID=A0A653D5J4_CALMS|nr:unnamed protein product [Callosobruchus maculatus]
MLPIASITVKNNDVDSLCGGPKMKRKGNMNISLLRETNRTFDSFSYLFLLFQGQGYKKMDQPF